MDSAVALRQQLKSGGNFIGYQPVYPAGDTDAYSETGETLQQCALPGDFSEYEYTRSGVPILYVMLPSYTVGQEGISDSSSVYGIAHSTLTDTAGNYSAHMGGKIPAYQAGSNTLFGYNVPAGPNYVVQTGPVPACQVAWNAGAFTSPPTGSNVLPIDNTCTAPAGAAAGTQTQVVNGTCQFSCGTQGGTGIQWCNKDHFPEASMCDPTGNGVDGRCMFDSRGMTCASPSDCKIYDTAWVGGDPSGGDGQIGMYDCVGNVCRM